MIPTRNNEVNGGEVVEPNHRDLQTKNSHPSDQISAELFALVDIRWDLCYNQKQSRESGGFHVQEIMVPMFEKYGICNPGITRCFNRLRYRDSRSPEQYR